MNITATYILVIVIGIATAIATYYWAKAQIKSRCAIHEELNDYTPDAINKKYVLPLMILANAAIDALSVLAFSDVYNIVFAAVVVPILIDIFVVDLFIRRIPNSSLLIIMIAQIARLIIQCVWFDGDAKVLIIDSVVGLVVGYIIFIIPSMFHLYMGSGDIKFSAVTGFALGLSGFLETMLISGIVMFICLIVLKVTKKGNGKTKAPQGPSFSFGFIISLFAPLTLIDFSSLFWG